MVGGYSIRVYTHRYLELFVQHAPTFYPLLPCNQPALPHLLATIQTSLPLIYTTRVQYYSTRTGTRYRTRNIIKNILI